MQNSTFRSTGMLEVMIKWQIKIILLNLDYSLPKRYKVVDFSNIHGFCNMLKIIFEGC